MRYFYLAYAGFCYLSFMAVFAYTICFNGNFLVSKSVDSGVESPLAIAIAINLALFVRFGLQHSVMARPGFKKLVNARIPEVMERSNYVLIASLAWGALLHFFRPVNQVIWEVKVPWIVYSLYGLSFAGWVIVFISTLLLDHFEFTGIRQAWNHFKGAEPDPATFRTPLFYRWVRHPMVLGMLLGFWAAARMTLGHLIFAAAVTTYCLVGTILEERELVRVFGATYRRYQKRVPMFFPFASFSRGEPESEEAE